MSRFVLGPLVVTLLAILFPGGCGSKPPPASPPRPAAPPPVKEEKLVMAEDIAQRLARFSPTEIDFDEGLLKPGQRKVLVKLVQAADILDDIYLDQVSPDNRALRGKLVAQKASQTALDYFDVMYGPWDRLDGDRPFIGTEEKPPGAGYYPEGLTREQIEQWIKAHPEQRRDIQGYFSVISGSADKLQAIPYAEAYKQRLRRAAALLKEAAALCQHPALKRYLELRAAAFLSNDYYESDKAWMDLGDSPLEVVLGPYEVYEDRLMGYKAAMEAFLTLRDPADSARLQKLAGHNQALDANLPIPKKYHTKRGSQSPISVVLELYTAGDTRAGVQTAAFNLPNDERVRTEKGSKKVLLKNVMEAKFKKALIPIARQVVQEKLLEKITFEAYFTDILLHEMAHGMGPGKIKVDGRETEVNLELKELYPAIEECKADIVGLYNAAYLIKKRALPKEMATQLPPTYLAGIFRAVRFGTEEAHAKAVLLAFNYLLEKGALTHDAASGRFGVNYPTFDARVRDLASELLMVQAQGSHEGAKKLLAAYAVMKPEMKAALQRCKDVPVDIRPVYTIVNKMKSW